MNDEVVDVTSTHIWTDICLLDDSEGLFFVRKEYAAMYARLVNARGRKWMPHGVVITGQPGIGTSFFSDSGMR